MKYKKLSTKILYFGYKVVDKTIYTWIICEFTIVGTVDNVYNTYLNYTIILYKNKIIRAV